MMSALPPSGVAGHGSSKRLSCTMSKLFEIGLVAGLIAAAAFATRDESALAKKAPAVRKQTHASWYLL